MKFRRPDLTNLIILVSTLKKGLQHDITFHYTQLDYNYHLESALEGESSANHGGF